MSARKEESNKEEYVLFTEKYTKGEYEGGILSAKRQGTEDPPQARINGSKALQNGDNHLFPVNSEAKAQKPRTCPQRTLHGADPSRRRRSRPITQKEVLEGILIVPKLRTVQFIEAWTEWIDYRIETGIDRRLNTTLRCFQKSMAKCIAWGQERSITAIDHSIEMGYRGLFEPYKKFHKEHVQGTIHTGVQGRAF